MTTGPPILGRNLQKKKRSSLRTRSKLSHPLIITNYYYTPHKSNGRKTLRKQDKDVFDFSFFLAQTNTHKDTGRLRVTQGHTDFRHTEKHRE